MYTNRIALLIATLVKDTGNLCLQYSPRSQNLISDSLWLIWPIFFPAQSSMTQYLCDALNETFHHSPPGLKSHRARNSLTTCFAETYSNVPKPSQSCSRSGSKRNNTKTIYFGVNEETEVGSRCVEGRKDMPAITVFHLVQLNRNPQDWNNNYNTLFI